ncbi:FAD-linked oxidase [Niastella koreensis]|uniref:D-lactate dehydrogenase (cytochrome) n=2 Tax=Niastella koreensis TaxID=354356 RepID=G8TM34_NIAKG|nr:FAD-binding and (Fe-S)-binding domain-containing protein [Niastella koreensis]AEV99807.1 D-lactate dehydrogenase (cytochrome) [Niastella koreensis GR20-10]OQP51574.1 FAD-linked oxidase [Niastella koreensis]
MTKAKQVQEALAAQFPADRLKTRPIDLHAYSSDASFYTLVPQAIVFPVNIEEVQLLFKLAKQHQTSLTFRTGGTSLSGQSVTEGILVDLSRNWPLIKAEQQGGAVRVQPGITGSRVNFFLKQYKKKIGPDPASINAAMMGGILSNNSSGMCCGVVNNSYHTLKHLKFVLPDGEVFDTENKDDYKRFETARPQLAGGILQLAQRVKNNPALTEKIRDKYKIKNTVGYSINAFLDYEHPLDILAHLLIGAEGTLAFIAEAVLNTIPDKPYKSTGLLFFESTAIACNAIPALRDSDAEALEFMDRAAIRSIEDQAGAPAFLKTLPGNSAGILCEYQSDTAAGLQEKLTRAAQYLNTLPITYKTEFTTDEYLQASYWKLRKGMYPSVAAVRQKGTSAMLEDIAVPIQNLGKCVEDLQQLFIKYKYFDAIIFGHAKEGNLHFLVSQSIDTPEEVGVFGAFNDELAELVIKRYNGALKAEHGTGRQIAPYVETEWGTDGYTIMKELKALVDPGNILNPGVIINPDKDCHLKNLKPLPVVEEEVDKCVECGYCEHKCPSRNFTLTPRQRIVLRRSLSRLKKAGDTQTYNSILKDYAYDGLDTCAVDGMCATECPVSINTGELVKRLRKENHSKTGNAIAMQVAKNFGLVERLIKTGLRSGGLVNKVFGKKAMFKLTSGVRKIAPAFPLWPQQLTAPVTVKSQKPEQADVVYFVSCISRTMGKDMEKKESIVDVCRRLSRKANVGLLIPDNLTGTCCAQPFASKGFTPAYRVIVNKTIDTLWTWSKGGSLPVVLDITSCTHSLQTCRPYLSPENQQRFDQLKIIDSLQFATDILLPRLTITKKKDSAVFHPVCSLHKMNLNKNLLQLAAQTVTAPVIPSTAGCCGMAGDRGFYYPGLTASATKAEVEEVNNSGCGDCYSTAKTCEMALAESSGKNYRSVLYLLDEVTQ